MYICISNMICMRLFSNCETRPNVYLDIFVQSVKVGNKIRCRPLDGQILPGTLWVECSRTLRSHYPIGTIFKVDVRKVQPNNRKPYLATFHRNKLPRAIEYFEYNTALQHFI